MTGDGRMTPYERWRWRLHRRRSLCHASLAGTTRCIAMATCRSDTYPTYMLALHKAHRLRQASSDRNVRGVLLVAWTDRIGWLRLDGMNVKSWIVTIGGRTDRSDPADVEMVVEFPIHQFSTLVTKENR